MNLSVKSEVTHGVIKVIFFIVFILCMAVFFWQSSNLGWLSILENQQKIQEFIKQAGLYGPLVIIFVIAIAIIISPIPSAPVALVSGALYGHTFGTLYVVLGALIGALVAFIISRLLGYDYISRKFHSHLPKKIMGSQNTMMAIVFISRLVPFISFDVISYAAGLTSLSIGRFFVATLMGVLPVSFMLAHFGSEMIMAESQTIILSILLLGFVFLLPLFSNILYKKNN